MKKGFAQFEPPLASSDPTFVPEGERRNEGKRIVRFFERSWRLSLVLAGGAPAGCWAGNLILGTRAQRAEWRQGCPAAKSFQWTRLNTSALGRFAQQRHPRFRGGEQKAKLKLSGSGEEKAKSN